jgi:hypothetical protein
MARHVPAWASIDTSQPDVLVVVFDLCFVAFFTGIVATGTALGTTTGEGAATGTTATGTVATVGVTDSVGGVAVVVGAVGTTTSTVGVSVDGSVGVGLLAAPALDCQPIAATIVNNAAVEAPAVMILEVRAGFARLRLCLCCGPGASTRCAGGDKRGSIIAATATATAVIVGAVIDETAAGAH